MRAILFAILFLNQSWAGSLIELEDFLKDSPCAAQMKSLLTAWDAQAPWRIESIQKKQALMIKAPSKKIGTWILLEKNETSKKISALRISPQTRLQVDWTPSTCLQKVGEIAVAEKVQTDKKDSLVFDDLSLEKLIDEKQGGIIYALSSQMHLSLEALTDIRKVAQQKNLKLTILEDADSKLHFPVLKAQDLIMRGMTMHFPSVLIFSKTGQLSAVLPGRKSEKEYLNFANEFLK